MYNNSEHSFWTHVYLECLHILYDMGFIYNHLRSFVPTFCAVWFLPKTESTVTIFRLNTEFLRKRWQILEFSLPHSDTNLQIFQICSQLLPSNFWISLSSTVYWAYHSSRTTYLILYINLLWFLYNKPLACVAIIITIILLHHLHCYSPERTHIWWCFAPFRLRGPNVWEKLQHLGKYCNFKSLSPRTRFSSNSLSVTACSLPSLFSFFWSGYLISFLWSKTHEHLSPSSQVMTHLVCNWKKT